MHHHQQFSGDARRSSRRTRSIAVAVALVAPITLLGLGTTAAAGSPDPSSTTMTTTTTTATTATTAVPASTASEAVDGALEPAVRVTPPIQVTPTDPPPTLPPDPCASIPENSGTGRRVVYSKSCMRVWAFEADGTMVKTHRVSGRMNQPNPGTYSVTSRSAYTCNIKNNGICWRYMIRFTKGPDGDNIGFHEIPQYKGRPVQSEAQLGQALSGGCVRQATADAEWMWAFAGVGTKVVVLA